MGEDKEQSKLFHRPGGMNSVPLTPLSRMSILWTPGAMYDLSVTTEAMGGCSLKPSTTWPLYMEMNSVMGVRTSNFLNLREGKNKIICLNTRMYHPKYMMVQISFCGSSPESSSTPRDRPHAPQQTHGLFSCVCSSNTGIIRD